MSPYLRTWDRALRLVIGVAALSFFGALPSPWRYLTLLGLPVIGTALVGWCPIYSLFPPRKTDLHGPSGRAAGG